MAHTTISTIYGLRNQLGLDDDTARDVYERETGQRSLTAMTPGQQVKVIQALRRSVESSRRSTGLGGPYGKMLQALWLDGWNLGIIADNSDKALLAFVRRQSGIERTDWLREAKQAQAVVEALKKWLTREAGVVWADFADPLDAVIAAQGRLLRLDAVDALEGTPEGQAWAAWRAGELERADKLRATKVLGKTLRAQKAN